MIGLVLVTSLLGLPTKVIAEPSEIVPELTIPQLIEKYSIKYNVSSEVMTKVIDCESDFKSNAHNGVGENSWGLVQINLNAHPQISVQQATDPDFAIKFLAENLSQGRGRMWTCYRKL